MCECKCVGLLWFLWSEAQIFLMGNLEFVNVHGNIIIKGILGRNEGRVWLS